MSNGQKNDGKLLPPQLALCVRSAANTCKRGVHRPHSRAAVRTVHTAHVIAQPCGRFTAVCRSHVHSCNTCHYRRIPGTSYYIGNTIVEVQRDPQWPTERRQTTSVIICAVQMKHGEHMQKLHVQATRAAVTTGHAALSIAQPRGRFTAAC